MYPKKATFLSIIPKNTVLAQAFLDYLLSDKAKPIWKKHGYELK